MTKKIKIIFFGTPDIALNSLEYLYNSDNIDVCAVVTQPDKPAGRGKKLQMSPIKKFAISKNLPFYQPQSIRKEPNIIEDLKKYKPDFFITFAFGQILSQDVLDIPKYETINLHASLLPKYRGANPIQRVLINGEKETGICTMITELGLDCGDICMKKHIDIPIDMNCEDLWNKISVFSPELLEKTIIGLVEKTITPIHQCEKGVCMANKITKEECLIDWSNSAFNIHNLVRGIYKSPCAHFIYKNKIIKVLKTEILKESFEYDKSSNFGDIIKVLKDGLVFLTGDGLLKILIVKPEGKKEMSAKDWYNGVKNVD